MPARKSCASRIMGERDVRAMAVSTSISTLASVPSTISTRIGSTVVPSGVSRLPCSYAVGSPAGFTGLPSWPGREPPSGEAPREPVAASTGARRVTAVWQEKHISGLLGDDEVAEGVDPDGEAGVDRHRRAELLDDRRALDGVAGEQLGPPPHVGVDVPGVGVEAHRPDRAVGATADVGRAARRIGELPQLRPGDGAHAGDAEVDPLDLLGRVVAEVVAVERAVLVVEAGGDCSGIRLVDLPLGRRDADLVCLAEVAQVDRA